MLRSNRTAILAIVLLPLLVSASAPPAKSIAVYFSPNGGCTDAIVDALKGAKESIRIQSYSFTSTPIARAIAEAKERDVKAEAVLDDSNQTDRYSAATYLANHGVPVLIDAKHAIAHNKIIIIDDATVITGSFNFSKAAEESNAENLLIISGHAELAAQYVRNFEATTACRTSHRRRVAWVACFRGTPRKHALLRRVLGADLGGMGRLYSTCPCGSRETPPESGAGDLTSTLRLKHAARTQNPLHHQAVGALRCVVI